MRSLVYIIAQLCGLDWCIESAAYRVEYEYEYKYEYYSSYEREAVYLGPSYRLCFFASYFLGGLRWCQW